MNDVAPARRLDARNAVSPAKFAHFVLRTGQFDKMAEWYKTVLGVAGGTVLLLLAYKFYFMR